MLTYEDYSCIIKSIRVFFVCKGGAEMENQNRRTTQESRDMNCNKKNACITKHIIIWMLCLIIISFLIVCSLSGCKLFAKIEMTGINLTVSKTSARNGDVLELRVDPIPSDATRVNNEMYDSSYFEIFVRIKGVDKLIDSHSTWERYTVKETGGELIFWAKYCKHARHSDTEGDIVSNEVVVSIESPVTYNFASGDGTEKNPYLIKTAEDLSHIYEGWGSNFKLANDIDLSRFNNVTPSGSLAQWKPIELFTGVLDGNNHTISGMSFFNMQGELGLIKNNEGTLKNINFVTDDNVSFVGAFSNGIKTNYALLCVYNKGRISNCTFSGNLIVKNVEAVAPIYSNEQGTIEQCSADLTISTNSCYKFYGYASLLVVNNSGRISQCFTKGNLNGTDRDAQNRYFAGIVVDNKSSGVIDQCYSSATIKATGYCDAFASGIASYNAGKIKNCYFVGNLEAEGQILYIYRVVGIADNCSGTLENVYSAFKGRAIRNNNGYKKDENEHVVAIFYASDTGASQLIRSRNCFFDSSYGPQQTSQAKGAVEDTALNLASTFGAWDSSIWIIKDGSLPTLRCFDTIN